MAENTENNKNKDTKNLFSQEDVKNLIPTVGEIDKIFNGELAGEDAEKTLKTLKDGDKAQLFSGLINLAERYLQGEFQTDDKKEELEKKHQEIKEEISQNITDKFDEMFALGVEKEVIKKIVETLQNDPKFKTATIEEQLEFVQNTVNKSVTWNEEENNNQFTQTEDVDDSEGQNASSKEEKVKKMYKYTVEGKITSGIEDLDKFLEIVQPALNLAIIQPWKLIYGAMDLRSWAKEKFIDWQVEKKNLASSWKTLQAMDILSKDETFKYHGNNKKRGAEIEEYFHKYMLEKLNANLEKDHKASIQKDLNLAVKQRMDEIEEHNQQNSTTPLPVLNIPNDLTEKLKKDKELSQKEFDDILISLANPNLNYLSDEYQKSPPKRTKFFDENKNPEEAVYILESELQNLIRKVRGADGKISEDGEKKLAGYMNMIDMFNKSGKSQFFESFSGKLQYISNQAKNRLYNDTRIEDEPLDNINKQFGNQEQEEFNKKIFEMFNNKGQGNP